MGYINFHYEIAKLTILIVEIKVKEQQQMLLKVQTSALKSCQEIKNKWVRNVLQSVIVITPILHWPKVKN